MIVLLCAALSGAMFYLSQGLDDVWWLTWFAAVPLLWLAYGPAKRWQLIYRCARRLRDADRSISFKATACSSSMTALAR